MNGDWPSNREAVRPRDDFLTIPGVAIPVLGLGDYTGIALADILTAIMQPDMVRA